MNRKQRALLAFLVIWVICMTWFNLYILRLNENTHLCNENNEEKLERWIFSELEEIYLDIANISYIISTEEARFFNWDHYVNPDSVVWNEVKKAPLLALFNVSVFYIAELSSPEAQWFVFRIVGHWLLPKFYHRFEAGHILQTYHFRNIPTENYGGYQHGG